MTDNERMALQTMWVDKNPQINLRLMLIDKANAVISTMAMYDEVREVNPIQLAKEMEDWVINGEVHVDKVVEEVQEELPLVTKDDNVLQVKFREDVPVEQE